MRGGFQAVDAEDTPFNRAEFIIIQPIGNQVGKNK